MIRHIEPTEAGHPTAGLEQRWDINISNLLPFWILNLGGETAKQKFGGGLPCSVPSKAHCRFFVLCVLARCLRFVPAASRGGMLSVCRCLSAVCGMRCASLAACAYQVTRPSTSRPYPPDANANQCRRSNWVVADERLAESPRWNPQCSLCKDAGIFVGQTFPVTKPFKHFLETFIIATYLLIELDKGVEVPQNALPVCRL